MRTIGGRNTYIGILPMSLAILPSPVYRRAMITARQIRAARSLLGWTQDDLAKAAGLSLAVVNNVEREVTDPRRSTVSKIQTALEQAGIEFLSVNQSSLSGGVGLRLRSSQE